VAINSRKRDTNARLSPVKIAAPIAVFATLAAVGVGVLSSDVEKTSSVTASQASFADLAGEERGETASRSRSRLEQLSAERAARAARAARAERAARAKRAELAELAATRKAIRNATKYLWTTADLNLWTSAAKQAELLGLLDSGKKVLVTGRRDNERAEIVLGGKARWVTAAYLSADKPVAAPAGLSMAPCPDPGVENGLTDRAVYVYRSVCNAFPQITSYGGWDGHGEHASGRAIDIMTSDVELGTAIAEFLRGHAAELNLFDVIWRQRIWTPERADEGWRYMSDRGSATANHYDHVHVSVN
jgi:hypothetical protein